MLIDFNSEHIQKAPTSIEVVPAGMSTCPDGSGGNAQTPCTESISIATMMTNRAAMCILHKGKPYKLYCGGLQGSEASRTISLRCIRVKEIFSRLCCNFITPKTIGTRIVSGGTESVHKTLKAASLARLSFLHWKEYITVSFRSHFTSLGYL